MELSILKERVEVKGKSLRNKNTALQKRKKEAEKEGMQRGNSEVKKILKEIEHVIRKRGFTRTEKRCLFAMALDQVERGNPLRIQRMVEV